MRNCKNQRIIEGRRRLEYRDNSNNQNNSNLNGEENLIVLN